jgi:hypothetical protein
VRTLTRERSACDARSAPNERAERDAAYVALAEERTTSLITDDDPVLAVAGDVARALADLQL